MHFVSRLVTLEMLHRSATNLAQIKVSSFLHTKHHAITYLNQLVKTVTNLANGDHFLTSFLPTCCIIISVYHRVKINGRVAGVDPTGKQVTPRQRWTKSGGRVSTPLGLATVHTIKHQHNYIASVSCFRVENKNQKDMLSEIPPPQLFGFTNLTLFLNTSLL